MPVRQLHHARVGVTAKTLANHKANVRAALRWFGKEHDMPRQGCGFRRIGRAFGIGLITAVTGPALQPDALLLGPRHRRRGRSTTRSLTIIGATAPRRPHWRRTMAPGGLMARAWNACASCNRRPGRCSGSPSRPSSQGRARLGGFPRGPAQRRRCYFAGLSKPHRSS